MGGPQPPGGDWASWLLQPPLQMLTRLELATEAAGQEAARPLGVEGAEESHRASPVRPLW